MMTRTHAKKTLAALTALLMLAACAPSSSANKKGAEQSPQEEDTVMYSPPEDADQPIAIPRGAPLADGYANPTSTLTPPADSAPADYTPGTVSKKQLDVLLSQGPGWALSQVQVEPARKNDAFQGFRITGFAPVAAAVMSPPLAIGDVITHLNGVRLEQPDHYMEAFNLSRSVNELRIDYVRAEKANYSTWTVVE